MLRTLFTRTFTHTSTSSDSLRFILNSFQTNLSTTHPHFSYVNKPFYHRLQESDSLEQVIQVLVEFKSKNLSPNKEILGHTIHKLSKLKEFDYAQQFFDFAFQNQLTNPLSFASLISAAGREGRLTVAKNIFDQAMAVHCYDVMIFNHFMEVGRQNHDLFSVKSTFDLAIEKKCFDAITFNILLDTASQQNHFALIKAVYENAVKWNCFNEITFIHCLHAAAKSEDLPFAKRVFDDARQRTCLNASTFKHLVNIARKNNDTTLISTYFDEMISLKHFDAFIIQNVIHTACQNNDIELAKKAYQIALKQGYNDLASNNIYVDLLVANKLFSEATSVCKEQRIHLTETHDSQTIEMDLHGFSYGTTYIVLHDYLQQLNEPITLCLITGKGLHSRLKHHTPPVKQAILDLVNVLGNACQLQKTANEGRLLLSYNPCLRKDYPKQKPSHFANHSLFAPDVQKENNRMKLNDSSCRYSPVR